MGQQQLLLIIVGVIIVEIAIAVGLTLFSGQSVQENKDAIINDLNNIAEYCYQYKERPTSMGGGQYSYVGCTLPSKLASSDNATYILSAASVGSIVITGTSTNIENGSISSTLDVNGKPTLDFSNFVQ